MNNFDKLNRPDTCDNCRHFEHFEDYEYESNYCRCSFNIDNERFKSDVTDCIEYNSCQ